MAALLDRLRRAAVRTKREVVALGHAYRDPRTPAAARIVLLLVVAYALSPIDLIPDPIPLLGQLDDLILVPLGVALAIRLVPPEVMRDARRRAAQPTPADRRMRTVGLVLVVAVWLLVAAALAWWLVRALA